MQKTLFFLFIFVMQACTATPIWESGMPKHHTTKGFRNYPIVTDSPALSMRFYLCRITSSFSSPDVPISHFLPEEDAIDLLHKLENENTITWIGQSTLLIRIDGFTDSSLFRKRGIGDKNKSLWCSWVITNPYGRYFFVGDSAYSPTIFKEIGKIFDSFDLAMVTIGTYGNRKYGVNNHTSPEEAVILGKEMNSKALLGIHWGTIELFDESPWEPPKRFIESAQKLNFPLENVWIMKIGETQLLPGAGRQMNEGEVDVRLD